MEFTLHQIAEMLGVGDHNEKVKLLIDSLQSKEYGIQEAAASALVSIENKKEDPRVIETLVSLLDRGIGLAIIAAKALDADGIYKYNGVDLIDKLIEIYTKDARYSDPNRHKESIERLKAIKIK